MLGKQIGNIIKNRRKELKITQSYLAELAKINAITITRIERGQGNPSFAVLEKLADVLGLEFNLQVKKV